jgi:hypothetical protein|tara:strand:+ start:1741 stop:2250 length:510 start_codon:yes stop_codon:yes gene_type:complete
MPYIVVDMDGTIADCQHRLHHLETGDWASFYAECDRDTPIDPVIEAVVALEAFSRIPEFYDVIIVTGREDTAKRKTIVWLNSTRMPYERVIMRKRGDYRSAVEWKLAQLAALEEEFGGKPLLIFEDRPEIIAAMTAAGYFVLQPHHESLVEETVKAKVDRAIAAGEDKQ